MNNLDASEILKGVDLFSRFSDEDIESVSKCVLTRSFCKDETIILQEDESVQALFMIASGEVKVYISGIDEKETILSILTKGDFFGEMSLIDGAPRSASVKSIANSEILILKREDFLSQIKKKPELAMSLMEEMSSRIRKANRQISSLATLTVFGRVANTISNLLEEKGTRIHAENGKMITIIPNRPTQQQLAEMSGTTRETVSRVINTLQKRGCISLSGKDMVVLEEENLKNILE